MFTTKYSIVVHVSKEKRSKEWYDITTSLKHFCLFITFLINKVIILNKILKIINLQNFNKNIIEKISLYFKVAYFFNKNKCQYYLNINSNQIKNFICYSSKSLNITTVTASIKTFGFY